MELVPDLPAEERERPAEPDGPDPEQTFSSAEELHDAIREAGGVVDDDNELQLPPLTIGVEADPNGLPVIVLSVQTPYGVQVYPLTPLIARTVGQKMREESGKAEETRTRAKLGLSVAKSRLIIPGK